MVVGKHVVVVGDGVAAHGGVVGEAHIDALEGLVGEGAVFDQKAVVEGVDVMALVVEGDVAVDELAAAELVVEVDPFARKAVNEVFVVVEAGVGDGAHEAHVLKADVSVAVFHSHHDGLVVGGGGEGHVLEGHVVGAVEGEGAVVGVARVGSEDDVEVGVAHAPEDDTLGLTGPADGVQTDKFFIRPGGHLEGDGARHAGGEGRDRRAKRRVVGVLGSVAVDGVGARQLGVQGSRNKQRQGKE